MNRGTWIGTLELALLVGGAKRGRISTVPRLTASSGSIRSRAARPDFRAQVIGRHLPAVFQAYKYGQWRREHDQRNHGAGNDEAGASWPPTRSSMGSALPLPWSARALIFIAATKRDGLELVTVSAYSVGLLAMLICSTVYNMAERSRHRELLRRLDHAAIFVMIAGTYTPFTTLGLPGPMGRRHDDLRLGGRGFRRRAQAFRVDRALRQAVDGALPDLRLDRDGDHVAAPWRGRDAHSDPARVGGIVYSLGTIVHAFDRLPFQRAIWHGLVVIAAAIHYAAIVALVRGYGPLHAINGRSCHRGCRRRRDSWLSGKRGVTTP